MPSPLCYACSVRLLALASPPLLAYCSHPSALPLPSLISCCSQGALVDRNAMLEAGSLLPSGARVPSGEVYGGSPASFVRKLAKAELEEFQMTAEQVRTLSSRRLTAFSPLLSSPPSLLTSFPPHLLPSSPPLLLSSSSHLPLLSSPPHLEQTQTLAAQHADQFLPYGTQWQLKEELEAVKPK